MKQIGDILGLTEKAAATKLHHARKVLEKEMERQRIDIHELEAHGFIVHGRKANEEKRSQEM